jgi:hypothetical protein
MSKRAIIVYGGYSGHTPKECSLFMKELLDREGFEIDLCDSLNCFSDEERMSNYDLIIPNWTDGELTGDQWNVFDRIVRTGIGVGGWHGGMADGFRANYNFHFMVGGKFVCHPGNQKLYTVNISETTDPIVADLKDFQVHSEQYYVHFDPIIDILATTTICKPVGDYPWAEGVEIPVVWKKSWGKGRVFNCSIGHGVSDFAVPEVRNIIIRGLQWAAR